jgi:signal transduction histidine kinase/CheY-like chemotaxis protein/HPt (histidine-containing phosphotransfer) domain-containing protein
MLEAIGTWLFDPSGLTPHGFCLLWQPGLIWTHALSDAAIGVAYCTIPVALTTIAWRRRDLIFAPLFWLFSAFILLCGAGHFLELLTLWVPAYGAQGMEKALTAVISVFTAWTLWHRLPRILAVNEALRTDILRSRENEAAARAARDAADALARSRSEFLATMSHEIRSPMSALVGVVDILRETSLDPEQSRMATMIHSSALALLGVLNDILDFAKIENRALSITPAPTLLGALVDEVAQLYLLGAARKGVAVSIRVSPGLPTEVLVDPLRLRQILNNLLSNAVKFTSTGEIALSVDAAPGEPEKKLRFVVRDSGIGMPPEVLLRLFSPFMQADGSTTRDFGGSGLGLYISQRLALLHGGSLTVVSRAGEGSAFTLTLPLRTPPLPSRAPQPALPSPAPTLAGFGRVLVADDDPTHRWLSQRQLEMFGLEVATAGGGEAALSMLLGGGFALLLTDYHMPGMDGVALARAVRAAADPALRALPIIGLTADAAFAQATASSDVGMSEIAIKPLRREQLHSVLARHLPGAAHDMPLPAAAAVPVVAFHDATYRDLFAPGDPDGPAWLANYLTLADRLEDELRRLLGPRDRMPVSRDALAALAHRLMGCSLSVGATRLAETARALERAARGEEAPTLRQLLNSVSRDLEETRQAIAAFLAGEAAA